MAAKLLLPGMGGQYTSETFSGVSVSSTGADTVDCSRCAQLAVQILSTAAAGISLQLQQTFDGSTWANLGAAITGTTVFDVTDGPFGLVRLSASVSSGSYTVSLTGQPLQTIP